VQLHHNTLKRRRSYFEMIHLEAVKVNEVGTKEGTQSKWRTRHGWLLESNPESRGIC